MKKKRLRHCDNKLAENASWDKELLGEHVEVLMAKDFDMGVVGFSKDELEQLLAEAGKRFERRLR